MEATSTSNNYSVSFIIPALNEEECIGETINSIPTEQLKEKGIPYEVLVIDGGSGDETRDIAREKGAKIIIEETKGYGRAYLTGFKYAQGDIIITGDADGTYPFEKTIEFVNLLKENKTDFITTNRLVPNNIDVFDSSHLLGNKLLSHLVRGLFRVPIQDSQSGMWAFKKNLLNKFTFTTEKMNFSTEIKLEAWKHAENPLEIPIPYTRRNGGLSKVHWYTHGPQILAFLLRKKLLYIFGKIVAPFEFIYNKIEKLASEASEA